MIIDNISDNLLYITANDLIKFLKKKQLEHIHSILYVYRDGNDIYIGSKPY